MKKVLYEINGVVIEGKKRGRLLGFPTINVAINHEIPSGIYASHVIIEGKRFIAATFIGNAKTFGEKDYKAESYILDFDEEIYGQIVTIELYKKLRDNKKFSSQETLTEQIIKDVEKTRAFFSLSTCLPAGKLPTNP